MSTIIETGGEVGVDGLDGIKVPDRIELLDSGMVKLVFKKQYERWFVPRGRVIIRTHTSDAEEGAEWW